MASSGSDWARRSANQTLAPEAYTVAWICAITTEYVAARQFLDEQHDGPDYQSPNDNNDYTLGKIGKHNVVLAVLPYGEYGLSNATGVAKDILHTFPKIKIGLMVGIGGGAPTPKQDIRLGDVVVGAGNGGVFQYDFGKAIQDKSFQTTGQLITPPIFLGTTISGLEADYEEGGNQIGAVINFILETRPQLQQKYKRPYNDLLYQTGVIHSESNESCEASCGSGPTKLVLRRQRAGGAENPAIHYGLIASANTVMKDAVVRDKLAAEKGVLCFEMEAAGLMKQFPCLVIRGICDYADTHKNKEWQGYAAMAAAAYATDFLHKIKPRALEAERDITRISSGIRDIRLTQEEQEKRQEIRDRKEKDYACRKALYVTDPSCDKVRIEEAKGGLLKDSYRWVLDQTDFKQFCGDRQSRMLWIKGDPGKGKTMLLCGIIDELEKSSPDTLSYFFCQATEGQYSNAVSVLRGLMYPLLIQHPSLIKHVREQFDLIGEKLFQGVNVWVYMVEIFMNMLTDPTSQDTILIVDALDECTTARYELLDFIIQSTQTPSSSVRWIISSRNWQEIETQLRDAQKAQLHLELNNDSIARAVTTYIEYKVNCLTRDKQYDENIRSAVQKHLITNAQGTFLWVALVCQQLAKPQVARRHTLAKLNSFPPGLDSLYDRMMVQIFDSEDADRCKEILAIFSVTYRPITVKELQVLIESPEELQQGDLEDIIASCGSFFTIQDGTIYFVHQSAKDYLLEKASHQILTAGIAQQHHALFTKSLKAVSGTIKRDIYRLGAPGVLIDQVSRPSPDPLASIGYSCVFWIDHFDDSKPKNSDHRDLSANNAIYSFIQKKYLYWLESLSLLRSISTGTIAIQKLANIMNNTGAPRMIELLQDARRFIMRHKEGIEVAPLQVYASALIFSPSHSIIRELFKKEEPNWITLKPIMERDWTACLQTLDGHTRFVNSVAFSPNSQWLASGSDDTTVKIWGLAAGVCLHTLEGHVNGVNSVAFSPDSQRLASNSHDMLIKIWNAVTGTCQQTINGKSHCVCSVMFSPDGQWLASSSYFNTVNLWDVSSETCVKMFAGHEASVSSVVFSSDGQWIASGSRDKTIKIWDFVSEVCVQTLPGHKASVLSVVFSPDGRWLASGSDDNTVKIWDWDSASKVCVQTFAGHEDSVVSVVFSPDGRWLASGSGDRTLKIWDKETGACLQTLRGHGGSVTSIILSPDNQLFASGSQDGTIKLWDIQTIMQTFEGHGSSEGRASLPPNHHRLASSSDDKTIRAWDTETVMRTLEGHKGPIRRASLSPDGQLFASRSEDRTIKLWDTATGACIQTFESHGYYVLPAFSPDNKRLASSIDRKTINVWDVATGACIRTLKDHEYGLIPLKYSPDGKWFLSNSTDGTTIIWNSVTLARTRTFQNWGWFAVFSQNSQQLALNSEHSMIRIFEVTTGACVQELNCGPVRMVTTVIFSSDDQRLAIATIDDIRIWDIVTGTFVHKIEYVTCMEHPRYGGTCDGLCLEISMQNLDLFQSIDGQPTTVDINYHPGYLVTQDRLWLTKEGNRFLWIPSEYRVAYSDSMGEMCDLTCRSGRVLIIKFLRE